MVKFIRNFVSMTGFKSMKSNSRCKGPHSALFFSKFDDFSNIFAIYLFINECREGGQKIVKRYNDNRNG